MTHHGACLRAELVAEGMGLPAAQAVLDAVVARGPAVGLAEADMAVADFARRLTRAPVEASAAHVVMLRERGFDDRAIYDIVAITGFFGFVNRVALGLGVPLEVNWEEYLPPPSPPPDRT
jgi:uncharacterized peroxidase-related enzyme